MASRRQVTFLINARADQFKSAMKSAERTFKSIGRDMERTGRKMSRNITAPIAIMGGLAVTAAAKFESSFADIRKTVDATDQQFGQISEGMRELARTIPTSVNELNRIGGVAGQLGVEAENIVAFTETIAKLGDTTDIVGEQAALSLSRFMNIMGTAQGDIDRLGSTVVELGNNFAAMESEIVEISQSLAPLGNSIGLSEQQVLAFSTTIAASGGKARAASTAFQKTANTMKQAVIEGNKDLQVFADTAGMTATAFQQAFQKDAGAALTSFLEGLRRVQEEGGSVATVLDEVGLADQRLVREFGKVLGNLDDLNRALPMANKAWSENSALTEEAQKRYETLISQLKITWNRIVDLGITIGNKLVPHVKSLNNLIRNGISFISNMSEESLNLSLKIAAIAAAVGPVLFMLGKLFTAIGVLVSPAFLAGAALTALFAGVVTTGQWFLDNWDKISQGFENAMLTMKIAAIKMARGVIRSGKAIFNFYANTFPPEFLSNIFGIDLSEMALDFAGVNDLLEGLNKDVQKNTNKLEKGIKKFNEQAWGSFTDSAKNALRLTKQAIINGLEGILNSEQIQNLIAQMEAMFSASASGGGSGGGEGSSGKESSTNIGRKGLPSIGIPAGKLEKAVAKYDSISEAIGNLTDKARVLGQALQTSVTNAVTGFAETLGNAFTGDAGAQGFFNNILLIVVDFANKFGKMLVAAGVAALAFKKLLLNPAAAIVAGVALIAATTAIKNLLREGPNGAAEMAHGGIVPEGFPNDTYPAMLSSGETVIPSPKALPAGMGNLDVNITGELRGQGSELVAVIKDANYKQGR